MKNNNKISIEEMSKDLPFSVPEDYFNQFALQIEQQIGYRKPRQYFLKSWMYIAAMFVGIFIIGETFYNAKQRTIAKNSENYESYVMAQVDEAAVVDYYVNDSNK